MTSLAPEELLMKSAAGFGINLASPEVKLYLKYMDLIKEWNKKVNLTSIVEVDEIIIKHFVDSLLVLPQLTKFDDLRVIDVGTGAGFPGIPLKIARPEIEVVLVDSLNKRINFLETVIEELGLKKVKAIHGRAEDLAHNEEFRERFDVVVSRAVSKMVVLVELCLPFAALGGTFIAYKGPKIKEEMDEAKFAIEVLGGKVDKEIEMTLPGNDEKRILVFIKKKILSPDKYPRKAGLPGKRPLIRCC